MDTLLAYGSDSSDSSSEAEPSCPVNGASHQAIQQGKSNEGSQPTRKRRWDQVDEEENPTKGLSSPQLWSQQQSSMIHWRVDYLSSHKPRESNIKPEPRSFLLERIERLDTTSFPENGLASQLRADHDFHNPRFLDSVADQCGIHDKLGNNFSANGQECFEEYEFNLLKLEEEAREKVYEKLEREHEMAQQQPSQFAQNQLERALQQHCHR